MLRYTFVTTSFDFGVDLRDVCRQHSVARVPGPPEPGPLPNYILAAYMASGT